MAKNLYIDCEWFPNQQIFLIGYAFNKTEKGQLYDKTLTKGAFLTRLSKVTGYIFFYGPDIAILEKYFNMDLKNNYKCVNLISPFRQLLPALKSHRLCELEKIFELKRSAAQYKKNIRTLIKDWYIPAHKKNALIYNMEDVVNLMALKEEIFTTVGFTNEMIADYVMKPSKKKPAKKKAPAKR